ncbi:hypothetical protein TTHERM_00104930 (macronuclear) [Tetrahymena thermophila SB210]|uniref:Uncharacterized protein n=1 Tax=Tetrahymena thermophila (strain SB210) TaxID=312017 RepID=Q234K3_TETTS|nr:hypothetical protein TTHERM_00104930 [Tetrahymena thermophila SB210]EAR92000.1 hypothetical protein TTHERM_00104930 [Tetrahymena thermophila SB210]|eukprot:XP_001012245.1 hypothetical protein TTHERM_00104930 [Tetrahymena thermophila SB210]
MWGQINYAIVGIKKRERDKSSWNYEKFKSSLIKIFISDPTKRVQTSIYLLIQKSSSFFYLFK